MSTWTNQATRTTENARTSAATRTMVCFEILDYDSLTHVSVSGNTVNVAALIYKKVTIQHFQSRDYNLLYSTTEANAKGTQLPTMPLTYLDPASATDNFNWSGTRIIEYRLGIIVSGVLIFNELLETVNISCSGYYNLSGTDKDLKEDAGTLESVGPNITVTGNRLYGVSVNCGKEAVTYSYDLEAMTGTPSNNVLLQTDAPVNIEDYNEFWTKTSRLVGAVSYLGISDTKTFNYGTSGTAGFPDKVMAVCYNKV